MKPEMAELKGKRLIISSEMEEGMRLNTAVVKQLCSTDEIQAEGHITMATVVDHIIPHRGDQKLFWDRSNWQPLCEHHHNVKTMTEDRFKEYRF